MKDMKIDLVAWASNTFTVLLVVICAGVFFLAWQKNLVNAVTSISEARKTAVYPAETHTVSAMCRLGDNDWIYSTAKELSDVKDHNLTEVRIWNSGYVVTEFDDGTMLVFSQDNCVVNAKPLPIKK